MGVVSIRVPREIKNRMEALKDVVDWPEEIRGFIARRIEEVERIRNVEAVEELLKDLPKQPRGSISSLVRESREGH